MTWPIDPEVKAACDFITRREDALTRRYEETREDLVNLRRQIAAGCIAPSELDSRLRMVR